MPSTRRRAVLLGTPSSRQGRSSRSNVSYREPSSEDSMDELSYGPRGFDAPPEQGLRSSTMTRKRKRAPAEPSLDQGSSKSRSEGHTASEDAPTRPKKVVNGRGRPLTETSSTNSPKKTTTQVIAPIKSSGIIPPWSSLPYHILLQIFTYASYPLVDNSFHPSLSLHWLITTSRLCKLFFEPAMTALYQSPPLLPSDRPHALLELLSIPSEALSLNYKSKIKRLEIDVLKTLAYSTPGLGWFNLALLVQSTPQLKELELYHTSDSPPYRDIGMIKPTRWIYSEELFEVLEDAKIQLNSWRWNTKFSYHAQLTSTMEDIHQTSPFRGLQRLALVNFHPEKRPKGAIEVPSDEQTLARALEVLPQLSDLTFITSSIVNEDLLPLLPNNLTSLSIVNCASLSSEILYPFLKTHGRFFKELVLNHNQSLSLSFLPDLAISCPQLQVLKMDLQFYNSHATYHDSDPRFEALLLPGEIPTWPSTLRIIELGQLRRWSVDTAEMFFGSLIHSASDLPYLRRLVLKATLEIGWRDRAHFRDQWIGRLQKTFVRRGDPPSSHLQSLRAFHEWKAQSASKKAVYGAEESGVTCENTGCSHLSSHYSITRPSLRRSSSSRLFSHVEIGNKGGPGESDDAFIPRKRRSTRIASRDESIYALPEDFSSQDLPRCRRRSRAHGSDLDVSSSDEASDEAGSIMRSHKTTNGSTKEERSNGKGSKHDFIQGLCSLVDIRIDNLRPTEEQFHENDFLDEEPSGDEDWDGTDVMPGEGRYAW
ncbi:MAG: hypothetical protein M1827_003484 [Pycnora praestabilis]|nr:MAG: hypothetical protein M1827_003484 [Pycnora praestabilis]